MGMLYATDIGVDVIIAANGSIYHSAFAEAASQYAYDHGVVQTYSGDDLNTANHNYPANYGHAMLIQGVATDTEGLGTEADDLRPALCAPPLSTLGVCLGSTLPVGTYFRGANTVRSRWKGRPAPRTPARLVARQASSSAQPRTTESISVRTRPGRSSSRPPSG